MLSPAAHAIALYATLLLVGVALRHHAVKITAPDVARSATLTPDTLPTLPSLPALYSRTARSPNSQLAGHDHAWLFLNGRRVADVGKHPQVRNITLHLRTGDVLAVKARNRKLSRGVYLSVDNRIYTGHATQQWQAVRRHKAPGWMQRDYAPACNWENAVVVRPSRAPALLPGPAGYVWAQNALKGTGTIFLRHVVGGDKNCRKSSITIAANNAATLYINGIRKLQVRARKKARTLTCALADGDVITVISFGTAFGVDLRHKGVHYVTEPNVGPWVVSRAATTSLRPRQRFMLPRYKDCLWKFPSAPTEAPEHAPAFPLSFGAQYVWSPDAPHPGAVHARFVVGVAPREGCKGPNPLPKLPKTCPCKQQRPHGPSRCYDFTDSARHACRARVCKARHVCVPRAKAGDLVCVRRRVVHRIVPRPGVPGKCVLKGVREFIYVPYH